ncbi:Uncharacterised protein [Mycobacteroides abscessus subsp. abscessus]|nr:hypothetical protein [Mycobacteroides abscessus]PBA03533.1 hypothetical protein CKJ73_25225 [Mycobacterium avium]SLD40588.1 Uncharacterised protein [Mycobacteroides abscessus subsp. abscessus]SLG78316.1 Uncharacterised protein [Mycobacteroides abscessus subsp. abscessus]SLL28687.1 Uncharacterised protein [Mycobacteroides abscessus subsp. abscessus]
MLVPWLTMTDATQRQYDEAVKRLKVAEEALEVALEYQTDPEDGAARWAKVRALQAQAQLHVLHSISYDLSDIRGAIEESA